MDLELSTTTTYPQTAWLVDAVPVSFVLVGLLIVLVLLRGQLTRAVVHYQTRKRAQRIKALHEGLRQRVNRMDKSSRDLELKRLEELLIPDAVLVFTPQTVTQGQLVGYCLIAAIVVLAGLAFLPSLFLALVLAGPLAALIVMAFLYGSNRRYVAMIDRTLPAAVGRLYSFMKAGRGFRESISRVIKDMDEGPLKQEWTFLYAQVGATLGRGGIATAAQVAGALSVQTPSSRHQTLLSHLAVALNQANDAQMKRIHAAYAALQQSERRRSEAVTQLAQVRYSGLVIGLAGVFMAVYLVWTQWDRALLAYTQTVLGPVMASLVGCALAAPIIGGMILSQVTDQDY